MPSWSSLDLENRELMSAFYNYSEPFSAECRAFGRLQEAGREDLAVPCFGYILLDEQHERALADQFRGARRVDINFDGAAEPMVVSNLRSRFPGRDGREPPIRGIVKALGTTSKALRAKDARRILRNMISLQQLGIINLDPAYWHFVSDKFCDFSTAITTPHFVTNPELNPSIAPEWIPRMEFDTFHYSANDFWAFDSMVLDWNIVHDDNPKDQISVSAFPRGEGCRVKYSLRSAPAGECVYSFVDPRRYDWRLSKPRRRLAARPPRWIYNCGPRWAEKIRTRTHMTGPELGWEYRDGHIFPCA